MNVAAPPKLSPAAQRERLAQIREHIHELCGFLRIHAELAQTYAALGDDAGLGYALEHVGLFAKAALEGRVDLEIKSKEFSK